ncbi:MAG: hypothetical protein CHACPFDD_00822 [Phycisphaerae bacterium]|nr:hypothetical protein [Phycisphaerae bacterium]
MNRTRRVLLAVAAALLPSVLAVAQQPAAPAMKTYKTRYYVLRTDLDADAVAEATLRITLLAEEYHRRTRDFSGQVGQALPFFLFRNARDYYAAGGLKGSAGVFTGDKLMAIAHPEAPWMTWRVVQHEGFHQFARAAIGDIPPWANEGLAEYFGFGLFTGDDFYVGAIPPAQLAWLRKLIADRQLPTLGEMMRLEPEKWNTHVTYEQEKAASNYVQAWSMVYFLAHADNGRYQAPFAKFLKEASRAPNDSSRLDEYDRVWDKHFGRDRAAFEQRWKEYWLAQPDNPSAELYARATTATLTSFLARAFSQRQTFESFDEFAAAGDAGTVNCRREDWLPPALLKDALAATKRRGAWSLEGQGARRQVICKLDSGVVLEGSFAIANGRVKKVSVAVRGGRG